jgi:phage terminase large subunit-like protein
MDNDMAYTMNVPDQWIKANPNMGRTDLSRKQAYFGF